MSTPMHDHYKGYDINVQALRREKERDAPDGAPRHFDVVVTLSRSTASGHVKTQMFGVPTPEPFADPIAAHRAAIQYARDLIDGKVAEQSPDDSDA
jgi:hypothetical protein